MTHGHAGPLSAIVLAAGEGTRMRSNRPKPLHRLCGRPMVLHVLDALAELDVDRVVVVVGHGAEWVGQTLVDHGPKGLAIELVRQHEQRGTGDAAAVGLTGLPDVAEEGEGDVVVLPGDTPLLRPPTLAALVRHHRQHEAGATLLTAQVDDAAGYGRVVRGKGGTVRRIVEHVDATAEERLITEVNTSIYCFRRSVLAPSLRRLVPANEQGEYYLTDVIEVLAEAGYPVEAFVAGDPTEAAGVNDRAQLAVAEAELRDRINERWMRRGVTMWDPERTYVDADVQLAPDVSLLPGVILRGECTVGDSAEIGPNCTLEDTRVGERAEIRQSVCTGAMVGAGARVGPFAVLGRGADVAPGAVVYRRLTDADFAGELIDLAVDETLFRLIEWQVPIYDQLGEVPERVGNGIPGAPSSVVNAFKTADGRWMTITSGTVRSIQNIAALVGEPVEQYESFELIAQNRPRLEARLEEWMAGHSAAEGQAEMDRSGVVAAPIFDVADILDDPTFAERGNVVTVPDRDFGQIRMPGVIPRLTNHPGDIWAPAPTLGADDDYLTGEVPALHTD